MARSVTRRKDTTSASCPLCSGPVLVGSWYGMEQTVDATELGPTAELDELVAGGRTWTHHTGIGELHPRTPWIIRTRPAGTRPRQTVHATHRCPPTPERTPTP